MNKEEIEKVLKINETIITSEQCKENRTLKNNERVLLMNNIKIKDYIQELEQKESILDKVIDKLKEIRRELDDDGFGYYAQEITNVLNIIEGEKK